MTEIPEYIGPMAMGIKMGVIIPGTDIVNQVFQALKRCYKDELLHNRDIVCITESVVARAQNNFVTVEEVSKEIKKILSLSEDSTVGVVFPITSRNRFSMLLKAIAGTVPDGKVIVQFSYPCDEVGNQTIDPEFADDLGKKKIEESDIEGKEFKHPITQMNYIQYYKDIINNMGAEPIIILSNDPLDILTEEPCGVIAADIHTREKTKKTIKEKFENCITLSELFNKGDVSSKWGLLGSNMSSKGKIKLAPKDGDIIVGDIQKRVYDEIGLKIEVLIYGDGAYKDPSSGIYELADPSVTVAATEGLNLFRRGIKYKYIADKLHSKGKTVEEIEAILKEKRTVSDSESTMEREGTTPRKMEDILGSLADLVSGSADAGTPVVLVKKFLD